VCKGGWGFLPPLLLFLYCALSSSSASFMLLLLRTSCLRVALMRALEFFFFGSLQKTTAKTVTQKEGRGKKENEGGRCSGSVLVVYANLPHCFLCIHVSAIAPGR
jgi:hypothetical protein